MLTVEIIAVGKVKSAWIQQGIAHYSKLLSKYTKLNFTTIRDAGTKHSEQEGLQVEAERIEAAVAPRALVLLLEVTGKPMRSEDFAALLSSAQSKYSHLQFVIGGAFGLSPLLRRSDRISLSLSTLTMPHELCQVMLIEQLYRGMSITAGSSYHK